MELKKVYVGNLPYSVTSDQLKTIFSEYGEVLYSKVITDRDTGSSKGFGFVGYQTANEMKEAIDNANDRTIEGRAIRVNEAVDRKDTFKREGNNYYSHNTRCNTSGTRSSFNTNDWSYNTRNR